MSDRRFFIVIACLVLAESICVYAGLNVIAIVLGYSEVFVPWVAIFGQFSVAVIVASFTRYSDSEAVNLAIFQAVFGLISIYVFMGFGLHVPDTSHDLLWILRLTGRILDWHQVFGLIMIFITYMWIWKHGFTLVSDPSLEIRVKNIFKFGLVMLGITILFDQMSKLDTNVEILLFPFLGATLFGMATGQLPSRDIQNKKKGLLTIVSLSVFMVLALGGIIGFLGGMYGQNLMRMLYLGWGLIVDGFIWILKFPLSWIFALGKWIFGLFPEREPLTREPNSRGLGSAVEILGLQPKEIVDNGPSIIDTILNILQYPLIILVAVAAFLVLALAFKRIVKRLETNSEEDRQSIREDMGVSRYMLQFLGDLLPNWLNSSSNKQFTYSKTGPATSIFDLYFRMMTLGVDNGMVFQSQNTPTEHIPLLVSALPMAAVEEITMHFNAALYGDIIPNPEVIDSLNATLKKNPS